MTRPKPSADVVLSLLGAEPLALAPSAVRGLAPAAFWGWDDEEDDEPGYELVGDLAVITVRGVLMQRGCWWWHGYDTLSLTFERALLDGRARAVVLAIDSPGGVVAGLFDTVRRMRASADAAGKQVIAVSDERCYSAAYALACVADAIVVPGTAGAGSIGVIGTMVSWSAALEAAGVDVRVIVPGAEKADGHPSVPMSDGAVAREQARVDQLAEVFFAWVTERRGFDPRSLEAGIRLGPEAVTAKLADKVGTLAAILNGELPIEDCCAEAMEDADADDVPVPLPGDSAAHHPTPSGASRMTQTPRNSTMPKDLIAILAALGATDAAQGLQIATDRATFRTKVLSATKAETDDAALGTLHAWQRDASAAEGLRAQVEADRKARAAEERKGLLAAAVASMRLTPAEAASDGDEGAWVTSMSNDALKAFAARSAPALANSGKKPAITEPSASSLTEEQSALAAQLGLDPAELAKALAAQG